jgi:hypothetical protein
MIVGITGTWRQCSGHAGGKCNGKTPSLRFTDRIDAKDFCAEGKDDKDNSLVVLFDGGVFSYHCDGPHQDHGCPQSDDDAADKGNTFTCVRHIVCTKASFFQDLAAAILPLFAKSPTRYVTPVSRGIEPELSDGVVLLQDNRIDFAPAFQEMDPATYRIRLEPLSNSAQPSAPVQLRWTGSGPALAPVPGVQTGLYRLVRLDPSGESAGPDAWVFVSGPDRFSRDSSAFRSAVEATKKWPDAVDARAPRAVLRAYLDSISRQANQ